MGKTSIEWAHFSFNPWWGCEKVSPGCQQCYAESDSTRFGHQIWGKQAPRRFFSDTYWRKPIHWNVEAERLGLRYRVFCASMADIMEDRTDLYPHRARLWELIHATPHLDWLLLTKRPALYSDFLPAQWVREGTPHNVWPGFTAEDQEHFDRRWRAMRHLRSTKRWISMEPLLKPIDLEFCHCTGSDVHLYDCPITTGDTVSWIVFGGESGMNARGCHYSWIRAGIRQCRTYRIAPFVKQLGSCPFDTDLQRKIPLRDFKGADMSEWPPDLRVREFPYLSLEPNTPTQTISPSLSTQPRL